MANIYRIFKRELRGLVFSHSTYIFLVLFLVIGTSLMLFLNRFFAAGWARLDGFFIYVPWLFMFFIPAVGMRLWAEEKKSGTIELLMTLPVRDIEVVVGKYLGALVLVAAALLLTFPIPVMVSSFADPANPLDMGTVYCAYLASFLLGATILAVSTWVSSLTQNQIVAFILACSITFALYLIGFPTIMGLFPDRLATACSQISPYMHFSSMYRGYIDASDAVYFLSAITFFLYLNVRSVESRKWA